MSQIFKKAIININNKFVLIKHNEDDSIENFFKIDEDLGSVKECNMRHSNGYSAGLNICIDNVNHTFKKPSLYNRFLKDSNFRIHLITHTVNNHSKHQVNNIPLTYHSKYGFIITDIYDLKEVEKHSDNWRMQMYLEKGYHCSNPNCNKKGNFFVKSVESYDLSKVHKDILTKNFQLMTVDHILPRSKGGNDTVDNLRPMCQYCNQKLGNSQKY